MTATGTVPADAWMLLTGGDGYLGRRLARRWLDATDAGLVLTVRARDGAELAAKRTALLDDLGSARDRLVVVPADLSTADPFAALDHRLRERVGRIVHAGAVTVFNVDRERAEAVNVAGTERVVELARRCPRLETLTVVSSIYASGLRAGVIEEEPLGDGPGFANFYEWSKWESEQRLAAADDLPWRIARVATVVADGEDGAVSAFNAVHQTLRLCFYGLISLLPGAAGTPLYLVTGDRVTDALARLAEPRCPAGVYHLAHRRSESLTLERLVTVAYEVFETVPQFRARRILRPLLVDEESFSMLVAGVTSMSGGLVRQALEAMAPFARQLYVDKDVRNDRARAVLGSDFTAPDPEDVVRRTCMHLVATGWGAGSGSAGGTRVAVG